MDHLFLFNTKLNFVFRTQELKLENKKYIAMITDLILGTYSSVDSSTQLGTTVSDQLWLRNNV